MVASLLDSLRSLQEASISDRILINSILFFSIRSCQREDRKVAVVHTRGNWFSSWVWKSRVRMLVVVMEGMYCTKTRPTPWFSEQLKKVWRSVSASFVLHLVQFGECLGRILATRLAVGMIWWTSLKSKLVRWGPSICSLYMCHVLSHINCLVRIIV